MNYSLFKNIFYENILLLYQLATLTPDNILSIKNNYNTKKKNLLENLNFLIKINFFKIDNNRINIFSKNEKNIKEDILKLILKSPEYGICLKNYLMNFKKNDSDIFKFIPSRAYNYETSDLRDLLITLGYIKNFNTEFRLLKSEILNQFRKLKFSPAELEKRLLNQKIIGLKAEKLILKNEITLLKEFEIKELPVHVANEDVSAGYDILSFRKINSKISEIFIEVKAVSLSNYQFYLSSSEYQTAMKLNPYYYIYLLPVDYSLPNEFDLKKLVQINNIKENLFENKIEWKITSDGYLIKKNT